MPHGVRFSTVVMVFVIAMVAGCAGPSNGVGAPIAVVSSPVAATTGSPVPAREPHTLVLTATGTATITVVTYVIDGQSTEERSVLLPWRRPLTVPSDGGRHEWRLVIEFRSGSVAVYGILNGAVVAQGASSSTGTGAATLSGSVLG